MDDMTPNNVRTVQPPWDFVLNNHSGEMILLPTLQEVYPPPVILFLISRKEDGITTNIEELYNPYGILF